MTSICRGLGTVVLAATLSGCLHQLPASSISLNSAPNFDASSIVSSKNGIVAVDISKVPGIICVPNAAGVCDADGFIAGQFLAAGATVKVTASTTSQPSYDSVLDNSYSGGGNIPFLVASASSDQYDEIKATTVATATIDSNANAGYPGIAAIQAALTAVGKNPSSGFVYWISAANTITVERTTYTRVKSDENVTGTGFGANGHTYNNAGVSQESVWIGIFAHRIDLEPIPAHPGPLLMQPIAPLLRLPPPVKGQFLQLDKSGNFVGHAPKS